MGRPECIIITLIFSAYENYVYFFAKYLDSVSYITFYCSLGNWLDVLIGVFEKMWLTNTFFFFHPWTSRLVESTIRRMMLKVVVSKITFYSLFLFACMPYFNRVYVRFSTYINESKAVSVVLISGYTSPHVSKFFIPYGFGWNITNTAIDGHPSSSLVIFSKLYTRTFS